MFNCESSTGSTEEEDKEEEDEIFNVVAENELGETCEVRRKGVSKMSRWMMSRGVVNNNKYDKRFVLRFLRASKFDESRAQAMITNYISVRKKIPEWFSNRNPKDAGVLEMLKCFLPLPHRDHKHRQLVFCRPALFIPSLHDTGTLMRAIFLVIDLLLQDEWTQVAGVVLVVDLEGFAWSHLGAWTPAVIRKTLRAWQDAYPIRVRGLHHYNEPLIFSYLYAVVRPFLKSKMVNRFHLHGPGTDVLLTHVDKDVIPAECGGSSSISLAEAEEMFRERMVTAIFSV